MMLLLSILFILQLAPAYAIGEEEFAIESAEIFLYRDGYAHASLIISVNEALPEVTVPLLSDKAENLLILDENCSLLDYNIADGNITIFTLGAVEVSLEYDTPHLLSYDSGVWTFRADLEHNWKIHLPEGAEVVYMSDVPNAIDIRNGSLVFFLPSGAWEISYVIPPALPEGETEETGWWPASFPPEYAVVLAAAAVCIIVPVIVFRRKRKFRDVYLRSEERKVLMFLAERGGRAFESEIRKQFPEIPRTSLWRLIRRLEKNGRVTVRKVGGANLVELK